MSCIDSLGEKNNCAYGGVLSVVALTAAAVLAIGIITLLSNQKFFSLFTITTPASIGMCCGGSFLLGAILMQSLRACVRRATGVANDMESRLSALEASIAPGAARLQAPPIPPHLSHLAPAPSGDSGRGKEAAPSLIHPSGRDIKPAGAGPGTGPNSSATIVPGERPGDLDDLLM